MSTSVGTLITASTAGGQSVACGSTSSPRVLHGISHSLPPPTVLFQKSPAHVGAPLSPSCNKEEATPSVQQASPQATLFIGSVPLNPNPSPGTFTELLGGPRHVVVGTLDHLHPFLTGSLTELQRQHLTAPFSDCEIRTAAFSIDDDKGPGPGPDGYSAGFFTSHV
ncbi:hypothetical protein Salat_1906600 [Sesamum alatum]|uniref:Uncharacterized protein n=1 Tax=Sesamum alatum TaxID=300844 RepID=A0AAE1Y501_9LAMI|nr:hypothetical protein Salat_1906600 [Sesamum alatum]